MSPLVADPAKYEAAKEKATRAERAQEIADRKVPRATQPGPSPFAVIGTSGVHVGLSAVDTCQACTPPDTTGAINSSYYMEMVNTRVGVYDRSLTSVVPSVDLGAFAGLSAGQQASDPQVQWDSSAGRWLYALISFNPNSSGHTFIYWGWTKTAVPTDLVNGWCKYSVSTTSELNDFPKLGHDSKAMMIGANVFNPGFRTAKLWAVTLPANGVTTCPVVGYVTFGTSNKPLKNGDGSTAHTLVPSNTTDGGNNDYVVAAHDVTDGSTQSKIMIWHIEYSRQGTPSLNVNGEVTVGAYALPPFAPQPGTSNLIDTGHGDLTQAVSQVDPDQALPTVWTQHTIRDPNGSAYAVVRWYELVPSGPSARQAANVVTNPTATNTFNAAISPTSNGNQAAIIFNQGDGSSLESIVAQTRLSTTPLSTMDFFGATLASSTVADTDFSCPGCAWGDYSAATPDPLNPNQVWGSSQTTGTGGTSSTSGWVSYNFSVSTILPPTCNTTTLTSGENHSLAVDTAGQVWAWGLGNSGQLGNNSSSNASTPVRVLLTADGSSYLTNVRSVAATQTSSIAALNNGLVYYWGSPYGEAQSLIATPQADPNDPFGTLSSVKQIAAGWQHFLVLKTNGTVWAWGQNVYGQLGNNSQIASPTPVQVSGITNAIAVAAGHDHSMALLDDGSVWAWGDNQFAQLGQNTAGQGSLSKVPVKVKGPGGVGYLSAIWQIGAGTEAGGSFAVSSDETIWAWGTTSPTLSWTPSHVPTSNGTGAFSGTAAISGFNHRLLLNTGFVWAYGPDNTYGQLGTGNNSPRTNPTQVVGVGGVGVLDSIDEVAAGQNHSLALSIAGIVTAWGLGTSGQLGNGAISNSNTPVYANLANSIAQPVLC